MEGKTWISQSCYSDMGVVDAMRELRLPGVTRGGDRLIIGRREWLMLPEFATKPMVAKVDTGARTSCLHAECIEPSEDGKWLSFRTFDTELRHRVHHCPIVSRKVIRNSCGVAETRYVIRTKATFSGGMGVMLDFTLADRRMMKCPILLGRRALAGLFVVDPQANYLLGKRRDF